MEVSRVLQKVGLVSTSNLQVPSIDEDKIANKVMKATDGEREDINAACARNNTGGCEGVIYVRRKGIFGKIPDWIEDMWRALKDPSGKCAYQ